MSVSYESHVVQDSPYTLPFDLNLMAKVDQYKQSLFYKNAANFENTVSQLQNVAIVNPEGKKYVTDLTNNLTKQVNDMGGIDYSDNNVSNTLENYGSSIYNNPDVIRHIQSSKMAMAVQAGYQKMQSDPKLNKYYSPANEEYDKSHFIDPYVNGGFDASYSGPSNPSTYLGNSWDLLTKDLSKLMPNVEQKIDDQGHPFFIDTITGKNVDRSRIMSAVDGKLDPGLSEQLKKEAWFQMDHLSGGNFTQQDATDQLNSQSQRNYDVYNGQLEGLQQQRKTALGADQVALDNDIAQVTKVRDSYKSDIDNTSAKINQMWKSGTDGKEAAMYEVYTGKLKNDIADVYSYHQESNKLQTDMAAVWAAKEQIAAAKAKKLVAFNADGTSVLQRDYSSEADLDKKATTIGSLSADVQTLYQQLNASTKDAVIKQFTAQGLFDHISPDQRINDSSGNPYSTDSLFKALSAFGDNHSFDLSAIHNIVQKLGVNSTGDAILGQGADGKPLVHLSKQEMDVFRSMDQAYTQAASGTGSVSKLSNPEDLGSFFTDYDVKKIAIDTKKSIIDGARQQIVDDKIANYKKDNPLSAADEASIRDFYKNPDKYSTTSTLKGSGETGTDEFGVSLNQGDRNITVYKNPAVQKLVNKIGYSKEEIDNEANLKINNVANRSQYYDVNLPDVTKVLESEDPTIKNFILDSQTAPGAVPLAVKDADNIRPIAVTTDGSKYLLKYTDKKNPNTFGYVPIEPDNYGKFGIQPLPFPELEQAVKIPGPPPTIRYRGVNPNITEPLAIELHSTASNADRSDNATMAGIRYQGKFFPYTLEGNAPNANFAYQQLKSFIDNYPLGIQDLLSTLSPTNANAIFKQ